MRSLEPAGEASPAPTGRVEAEAPGTARHPRLFGVLVTHRRPGQVATMLDGLAAQDRPLDHLVVVDNSPDARTEAAVEGYRARGLAVEYVAASENLGPAGGIALGMRRVLADAGPDDWITTLDDDNPPWSDHLLSHQERFARASVAEDPRTGGVGLVGARFDRRRGRMIRLPDDRLAGRVSVDYFGGGHLPLYLVRAVREVGPFREELFWGLEELDFGLRLRDAGYRLYVDGDLWTRRRGEVGRLGLRVRPSLRVEEPSWRSYYGLRNAVYVLRRHGHRWTAWRVTLLRGLLKPLLNVPTAPGRALRQLAVGWRACRDGWAGRMGRTVDPEA